MITDLLELTQSETVMDEHAAPSDIMWRIEEIWYMMEASQPDEDGKYYVDKIEDRPWLDRNIEHLIFVERGGL